MDRTTRRRFLAAAGTATLAGCLGSRGGDAGGSSESAGASGTGSDASPGSVPTADESLPLPMPASKLRPKVISGGVPKDGIPSIDAPTFVDPSAADDFLAPDDVVFGVVGEDEVKAYPQPILVHHEICNDTLDGRPVSVTYCPLTGTAMGFERGETTFGVSGKLLNNNLVMYDRAGDRWWPQVLATSISEGTAGTSLRDFRVIWTRWDRWKGRYPDTAVLSTDTGHIRNYENDPYGSYNPKRGYYVEADPMFPRLNADDRYHAKEVFIGARTPEGAVAFRKDSLREAKLMRGELAGTPALAVYEPTLDTGFVYRNPDGAAFSFENGAVVGPDGTAHAPGSVPLDRVLALDAMWFAWIGFYPESGVYA